MKYHQSWDKVLLPAPPLLCPSHYILKRLILQGREPEEHRRRALVWPDATRGKQKTKGTSPPQAEASTLLRRLNPETQALSSPKPETNQTWGSPTTYTQASRPPIVTAGRAARDPPWPAAPRQAPKQRERTRKNLKYLVPTATTDLNTSNRRNNSLQTQPIPCTD